MREVITSFWTNISTFPFVKVKNKKNKNKKEQEEIRGAKKLNYFNFRKVEIIG